MYQLRTIQFLILATLILIVVACQTTSPVISKGDSSWGARSGTTPVACQHRVCWQGVSPHRSQPTNFILSACANVDGLTKTIQDARSFTQAMQRRYSNSIVCPLDNVCRAEFEQALVDLKPLVTSQDSMMVYFSGHGSQVRDDNGDEADGMDEVLVPSDVIGIDNVKREHAITDDRLVELIRALPTSNVVTFLDACFAGGDYKDKAEPGRLKEKFFAKGDLGTSPPPLVSGANQSPPNGFSHLPGALIGAAKENEKAFEGADGGVFTSIFLKQLEQHPTASLREIFEFTRAEMATMKDIHFHPELMGDSELLNRKSQ